MNASLLLFVAGFFLFIGYCWGNSRKGKLVNFTNNLSDDLMRVISIDKTSAVLEEISVKKQRYLVSSEVFGGKPIRPKDTVRKIISDRERSRLGIPVLGYPPLVNALSI